MLDWQDKKGYAYTKGLSPAGWAFEFLRRNKHFQADYNKVVALRYRWKEIHGTPRRGPFKRFSDPQFYVRLDKESTDVAIQDPGWRDITLDLPDGQMRVDFEDFYQLKWKLAQPILDPSVVPNKAPRFLPLAEFPRFPSLQSIDTFFFGETPWESCEEKELEYAAPFRQRPGTAVVVFNLGAPLTGQLRKAEKALRARASVQKKAGLLHESFPASPSFHGSRLLTWLRVLDGVGAGAKKSKIWKEVFSSKSESNNPTSTINDALQSATALVAKRYWLLAMSHVVPMK